MAITKTQAGYLCTDAIKKGVISTIVNVSPFARYMPFITIDGNSYKHNLETTLGGANWYVPNETITEQTPVIAQRSVELAELINDADVDAFLQQVRSKDQDLKATTIELASAAIANEFEKQCIYGQQTTSYSTKQMKGLIQLIAEVEGATVTDWDASENSQIYSKTASQSDTLTLDMLDEGCDLIKPGKPDALITSRRMRRKITALARAAGNNLVHDKDELGYPVEMWGDSKLLVSDHLKDQHDDPDASQDWAPRSYAFATASTAGDDTSMIFYVKWGEQGVCGVENGGIQIEDIGKLETKDATRTRIKWYVGMANFAKYSIGATFGHTDD